jgi:ATP-dependent DNA helicase RecQ
LGLEDAVVEVLRSAQRPLLAREIAAKCTKLVGREVDRAEVNRVLYGSLNGQVSSTAGARWGLKEAPSAGGKTKPPPETPPRPTPPGPRPAPTPVEPPIDPDAPSCPSCGAPMCKRKAFKGRNAGSDFWGCSAFPACKRTLPLDGEDSPPRGRASSAVLIPHSMVSRPLRAGHEYAWFQHMTVAELDLESLQDQCAEGHLPAGSHWRVEYPRTEGCAYSPDVLRVLSVVDKILTRGRLTLLSPELESSLGAENRLAPIPQRAVPKSWFDSDDERDFLAERLAPVLGNDWSRWVAGQVEVSSLVDPVGAPETIEGRVDFLVSHPALDRTIVVEIDGSQHQDSGPEDAARDRSLRDAGYEVVRIPVTETRAGQGPALQRLLTLLEAIAVAPVRDASWRSPIRRAGQVQLAILHAVYSGLIDACSDAPVRVSSDLSDLGELDPKGFIAVLEDVWELFARVGALYGLELLPGGLVFEPDPTRADLHLSFSGDSVDANVMYVEDAWLPFALRMQPRAYEPGLPSEVSPETVRYFLHRIFHKDDFLEGQYEAVQRALAGLDAVVLLPTGAGKSIAFQTAAMLLPGKTVVVDPIIALIRDQRDVLATYGIDRVLGISSDLLELGERQAAYELLLTGDSLFYYVAPERFQIREFREKLAALTANEPVGLIVIDEAHCVSEWGHDFRTSYLRLGDTAREICTRGSWTPPVLALTGTASRAVLKDLQRELKITDFEAMITPTSFDRRELNFLVVSAKSEDKESVLRALLQQGLPARFGVAGETFRSKGDGETYCGLVFTPWTQGDYGAWDVATEVRKGVGLAAEAYSGGRPGKYKGDDQDWALFKRAVERAYKRNKYNLLVCTKAFGMGIDKPNIRYTVHYGMPPSIEAFYQEAGRAGRDRRPSWCVVIASEDDAPRNQRLLNPSTPVEEVAEALDQVKRSDQDDVTRALFFETKAFRGVAAELEVAEQVLEKLGTLETRELVNLAAQDDEMRAAYEKVLHRLVVLGVAQDYMVNYAAKSFDVRIVGASRDDVVTAYSRYVAAFSTSRSVREREKAEELRDEGLSDGASFRSFTTRMLALYLSFVYDVIERGRRRALAEMLGATKTKDSTEFRQWVLRYLESTEYSEQLEKVLEDPRAGIALVIPMLDDLLTPNEAAEARGQVARYLETYPDHPALLYLRALTEALCKSSDAGIVWDNLAAWMKSATENYAVADDQMLSVAAYAIRRLVPRSRELAARVEQLALTQYPDVEQVRSLVKQAGVEHLQIAPWLLLMKHADTVSATVAGPA